MPDQEDAVIWLRPEVTGRGRAPGHSRAQIAKAAIAVADAEGLDAASMRRVATEIGAAPMSLYRYVRSKEELHVLMADEVLNWDGLHWETMPEPDWAETLRHVARNVRRLVLAHPWWAEVMTRGPVFGPRILRMFDSTIAGLDGIGLDIDEMMEISEIIQMFVIGYALRDVHAARVIAVTGSSEPEQTHREWVAFVLSLTESGDYPYLRRVVHDARSPHETDLEARFERALDRVIAGIAATLPPLGEA